MKTPLTCAICALLGVHPTLVLADDDSSDSDSPWRVSLLMGVATTPTYLGDDDLQLTAFPDVRVEYNDRLFASIGGVGYQVVRTERWRAGPILRFDFGRDELEGNPLNIAGDDTDELVGLGDIEGAVEAGAFVTYETDIWQLGVEARQGLDGGHEGLILEAGIKRTGRFTLFGQLAFYSIGPEVVYGDADYQQTYFGITPLQSRSSGLATYTADSGLVSYGLHGSLFVPLTANWAFGWFAGVDRLGSEAEHSPLIVERGGETQVVSGLFVSYSF